MVSRKNERGVSLVELVTGLAIALVMTSATLSLVRTSVHNHTLVGAARDITRVVQLARYQAVTQGSNACTVLTGNMFGVDPDCDGALHSSDTAVTLPVGVTLTDTGPGVYTGMDLPSTPVAVASPFVIAFTPRGKVTAAPGIGIIYLTGWSKYSAVAVLGARNWQYDSVNATWR